MKKIINRKVYNTDTAKQIAEAEASCMPSDFQYWCESLYRTPKGAYFIAGSGGAMSRYAKSLGGGSTGGSSDIYVLSTEQAVSWLEDNNQTAALEEHFSDVLEEA